MNRLTAALIAAIVLLAGACGSAPAAATSVPARTAVPMWTLPFLVAPATQGPATPTAVSASATPAATQPQVEPTALPTEAPPTAAPPTATPLSPPRLVIPQLELDAEIEHVGIQDGTWDLTTLDDAVGWLSTTGRHPGDTLAVVLVGHVTTAPGTYGPFAGLGQLEPNAQVIYRWGGRDYVYEVRTHSRADDTDVQRLYVPNGGQLLLVTCTSYNYFTLSYERRLIVTAEWIGTMASQ